MKAPLRSKDYTVLITLFAGLLLGLFSGRSFFVHAGERRQKADPKAQEGLFRCRPTPSDSLGPFYEPDAPIRSSVGEGYELTGGARSALDCSPVPGARIEFWLAGPDGKYDDEHRATLFSDPSGGYKFESNFPPRYSSRPPHIHIRVSAEGYRTLITQHYPQIGDKQGRLEIVLVPQGQG